MPTWTPSGVRFRAMRSDDGGEPFIEGCTQAVLPAGIKFTGNGTCPHPLNIQITKEYGPIKALDGLMQFEDELKPLLERHPDLKKFWDDARAELKKAK